MYEEEVNEFLYQIEEDKHFEEYEQEQVDWLHRTHNPVYEYEGTFGEDDDIIDVLENRITVREDVYIDFFNDEESY